MKAVRFDEHGDPSVLNYAEYPDPSPGPHEVLLEMEATALNYLDIWAREGSHGIELPRPHVGGSDGVGHVIEVGDDVERFSVGDRAVLHAAVSCGHCEYCRNGQESMCVDYHVIGAHRQGVHAEYAAVPEDNLIAVPEDVPPEMAAAAPLVFETAWRQLVTRGHLRAGEDVLILGASGGLGHAAVQIAKQVGATVFATGSSSQKLSFAESLGADHTINYKETDIADTVRSKTGKRGVDAVFDHVGGATWSDSIASLAKGGRLLTCGVTEGAYAEVNINRVFYNQLEIIGSTMANPGEADDVLNLVWEGSLAPHVDEIYPMSDAERAYRKLESGDCVGKIVLVPDRIYDR